MITYTKDPAKNRIVSYEDLRLRYGNSIVIYEDKCYLASPIEGSSRYLTLSDVVNNRWRVEKTKVHVNNISTDFSNKLGWVQTGPKEIMYLQRIPARRYKQGISIDNLEGFVGNQRVAINFETLVKYLNTPYTNLETALSHGVGMYALSNTVAIKITPKGTQVYVNEDVVGGIDANGIFQFSTEGMLSIIEQELIKVGVV